MLLNAALSSVYVLIGSSRSILVYKGQRQQNSRVYPLATNDPADFVASIGMAEYITYFITVIGVFVLCLRLESRESESTLGSYRTSTVNPVIFHCISPLIVGRSAVEHSMNIVAIVLFLGAVFSFIVRLGGGESHRRLTRRPRST